MKPKLVNDWKRVMGLSMSIWMQIAGLLFLVGPEMVYIYSGTDYFDPRLLFWLGVLSILAGTFGRIVEQSNSLVREWLKIISVVVLIVLVSMMLASRVGAGTFEDGPVVLAAGSPNDAEVVEFTTPIIAKNEGVRLKAYLPTPNDVPTICFGSTRGIEMGMTRTMQECLDLLAFEVEDYWLRLKPAFTPDTLRARLPTTRAGAYLDLAYNCGVSAISRSTAVRRINAGDIRGGCIAIGWWNKKGERVLRGLELRRKRNVQLCMVGL